MAKKKVVDAEAAVEELKNKKFGLSIQNIIALVTVLSTGIAGWYSFTGRIDGLEEIVTGFIKGISIEDLSKKFNFSKITITRNLKKSLGEDLYKNHLKENNKKNISKKNSSKDSISQDQPINKNLEYKRRIIKNSHWS